MNYRRSDRCRQQDRSQGGYAKEQKNWGEGMILERGAPLPLQKQYNGPRQSTPGARNTSRAKNRTLPWMKSHGTEANLQSHASGKYQRESSIAQY